MRHLCLCSALLLACETTQVTPLAVSLSDAPAREASWDGQVCPAGVLVIEGAGRACEVDGVREGPSLDTGEGSVIVGSWAAGEPDGRWVAFDREGRASHEWHYRAGALHGPERYWLEGRLTAIGEWADDLETGLWERFVGNVVVESTTFHEGLRDGPYHSAYDDGAAHCSGAYERDLRVGEWACLYPDGALNESCHWKDGLRDGACRGQSPDGASGYEGRHAAGAFVGRWCYWATLGPADVRGPESEGIGRPEFGRVTTCGEYVANTRHGLWEGRWDDGRVQSTQAYVYDQRHGAFASYYRDGGPMEIGTLVADAQHGTWRYYYRDGQLAIEATWFKGVLEGPYRSYWPSGQLELEGTYKDGVLQAGARRWNEQGDPQ